MFRLKFFYKSFSDVIRSREKRGRLSFRLLSLFSHRMRETGQSHRGAINLEQVVLMTRASIVAYTILFSSISPLFLLFRHTFFEFRLLNYLLTAAALLRQKCNRSDEHSSFLVSATAARYIRWPTIISSYIGTFIYKRKHI